MPKNLKRTGAAALDLKKIEEMASKGLTLDQIAGALGIDVRTLYTKRKRFAEVATPSTAAPQPASPTWPTRSSKLLPSRTTLQRRSSFSRRAPVGGTTDRSSR